MIPAVLLGASAWSVLLLFYTRKHGGVATAPVAILVVQLPFVVGLVTRHDTSSDLHAEYLLFVSGGLILFTSGAVFVSRRARFSAAAEFRRASSRVDIAVHASPISMQAVTLIGIAAVAVGVLFVRAIGYNAVLESVFRAAGDLDPSVPGSFRDLRALATRSSYVAAGYVLQFTGVLLPAAIAWLGLRWTATRDNRFAAVMGLLLAIDLYVITAVGGRKTVLELVLILGVIFGTSSSLVPRMRSRGRGALILWVLGFFVVFGALTVAQGRLELGNSNYVEKLSAVGDAIYNRVGGDHSETQLVTYEILKDESPRWGAGWFAQLASISPGPDQHQTLDSRLHEAVFGNPDGNLPLVIWGSMLYDWGPWLGLALLGVWGAIAQWITVIVVRQSGSLLQMVVGQMLLLRMALVRDPFSLLLEGVMTLAILWLFLYGLERRNSEIALKRSLHTHPAAVTQHSSL